jgi:inorganic pyrophosphatase
MIHHSDYAPLPHELKKELQRFFKPYNDLLSELLDSTTITDSWKDKDATGNSTYMYEL